MSQPFFYLFMYLFIYVNLNPESAKLNSARKKLTLFLTLKYLYMGHMSEYRIES